MAEEKENRKENDKTQGSDQGTVADEEKTSAPEMTAGQKKVKTKRSASNIIAIVVAVILIILIIPSIAVTVTISIKAAIDPDTPPSIFGYAPLTVASGSMEGIYEDSFDEGDLIFIRVLDDDEKQELAVGDVICYKTDDIFVTHRIYLIYKDDGGAITSIICWGDSNSVQDDAITLENVYGIYAGKVANLGSFAEFLQTPAGIAVFIAVPVAAFILFNLSRVILLNRNKANDKKMKSQEQELQTKEEEIARLKRMLEEQKGEGSEGDKSEE